MNSSGLVCTRHFDTPGVLARSAALAAAVSMVMMGQASRHRAASGPRPRFQLLYAVEPAGAEPSRTPKFFPRRREGDEATAGPGLLMEEFVAGLERHLDTRRREICIYDLWRDTRPPDAADSLVDATSGIYQNLVYRDLWSDTVRPFVRDYQAAHRGRRPFIEAITQARLEYGANVSVREYDRSVAALDAYARWVNTVLLPAPRPTPAAAAPEGAPGDARIPLLVLPQSWGAPRYRDEGGAGALFWPGFSAYSISYASGCPDLTLPVGEAPFRSRVAAADERLPVAVSLLAPRGLDAALLRLVDDLHAAALLRPVGCGPSLYRD